MKIIIESDPSEAAEFLAKFIDKTYGLCRKREEDVLTALFQNIISTKDTKNTLQEEVPAGGHFH